MIEPPAIVDRAITLFRGQTLRFAELTAIEKRDYLFEAGIRATAYDSGALPDVHLGVVEFASAAATSFVHQLLRETITRVSDELEAPKHKLFHTFGTTAKVRFDPEPGTGYTGLFAEAAPGLARFSYAGPVVGIGIVPGLGLKLFVDGDHPSENGVMMRKLDPQWDRSVFHSPFTNILPAPAGINLIMQGVQHRFESVVEDGRGLHQPVDNFARISVNGVVVPTEAIRAPFRVILAPTPAARAAHDGQLDFREDLARNVPAGTVIYDVLGLDEAASFQGDIEELAVHAPRIGTLTTESEWIASSYGDHRLFFKHNATYLRPG
jgi:hypothetical protein